MLLLVLGGAQPGGTQGRTRRGRLLMVMMLQGFHRVLPGVLIVGMVFQGAPYDAKARAH